MSSLSICRGVILAPIRPNNTVLFSISLKERTDCLPEIFDQIREYVAASKNVTVLDGGIKLLNALKRWERAAQKRQSAEDE
jgi:hypothetical protein